MEFYSQWGEDKALLPLFGEDYDGYFVDVGALDGIKGSNTYLFERLGWKGICIEPHEYYFPKLSKNRKCICLDVAVWDENAETSDFYATKIGTWSRIGSPPSQKTIAKLHQITRKRWKKQYPKKPYKYGTREIQHPKLRTLDYILKKHNAPKRFDLLSIDVEGTEQRILNGFSLNRYMPRVVIIEDHFKKGFGSYFKDYTRVRGAKYRWKGKKRPPFYKEVRNDIYFRDRADAVQLKSKWYIPFK